MASTRYRAALVALLISGVALANPDDASLELSSGQQRVTLIELFTSEGCSSCPPADRWLSSLETDPGLWREFVPIAFHVDYWDQIGWIDRFARAEYSERQRRYATEGGVRVVYTPGMFRDGVEWRNWQTAGSTAIKRNDVGDLSIEIKGQNIEARFDALANYGEKLTLHVAILGMNLETDVRAGENRDKILHHDFVALGFISAPLEKVGVDYIVTSRLPRIKHNATERAVVAWVSEDTQAPIQSVGGYFLSDR